jgi:hypothetical protein
LLEPDLGAIPTQPVWTLCGQNDLKGSDWLTQA